MENPRSHGEGGGSSSRQSAAPLALPAMQQLPPQMFTTAASLLDLTDKKLMVALRDGRKLIGILRSWDQYGNLVLQDTIERRFVGNFYADVNRGIYLVRGENIMLMGEIVSCYDTDVEDLRDLDKDDYVPEQYQATTEAAVFAMEKNEESERKRKDAARQKRLKALGFEGEHSGEALF